MPAVLLARRMASLAAPLLDLVLPRSCGGCGRPGESLCRPCTARLTEVRRLDLGPGPSPGPPGLPVACGPEYRGELVTLLHAWKEGGRRDLAAPLAVVLAAAVRLLPRPAGGLLLVPVPSARPAVRRRGEDVVARLAELTAAELAADAPVPAGDPVRGRDRTGTRAEPVLRQVRTVADQAGLGVQQRHANVHGAFGVVRARPGPVVVVDDVLTTGASTAEAVRALRRAEMSVIGVATVAHTIRRTPRRAERRVSAGAGVD